MGVVNPYQVLAVDETADLVAIKKAYRHLARTCHPDLHGQHSDLHARFIEITSAYKTLTNPLYRLFFDTFRRDPATLDYDDSLIQEALRQEQRCKGLPRRTTPKVPRVQCPDCEGTGIRPGGRNCQSCDDRLSPGERPTPHDLDSNADEGRIRIPKTRRKKPEMKDFFRSSAKERPTRTGANKPDKPSSERVRLRPKKN